MNRRRIILGVAIAMLTCSALVLGGCSKAASDVTNQAIDATAQTADDARTQSCYASQRMIEGAARVYEAETGDFPNDIPSLVPKYAPKQPECASGGSYSLTVEDGQAVCACSEHGHYAATNE